MTREEIINYFKKLEDKEFIELFYESVKTRSFHKGEASYLQSHLILAEASRMKGDNGDWEGWEVEVVAQQDFKKSLKRYIEQIEIAQGGTCFSCQANLTSWAKDAICSVCFNEVRLT